MNFKIVLKRRSLTRLVAFITIVCYDIHNSIESVDIRSGANHNNHPAAVDNDRYAAPRTRPNNHIYSINNIPLSQNDTSIRISFSVHDPQIVPFENKYVIRRCKLGELKKGGVRTNEIPPSLLMGGLGNNRRHPDIRRSGGRILDFTTTISTNLKILQIGDSITIDMAESLDEMMGGAELDSRYSLWEQWAGADGGTITAPTRGGGMHGGWRMTGLLSKQKQGHPSKLPYLRDSHASPLEGMGGGWNYDKIFPFLKREYQWEGENITVKKLDVVIFRVMHGWMTVEEITRERIVEAAELANSILGATTIVFMTVPFTNNVKTVEIMDGVRKINDMIRDVARNWHLDHDTHLLVMEYAAYTNHVIWTNARHLGYNVSDPLTVSDPKVFDVEGPTFLQDRLQIDKWPPSIPMVCNKKPMSESGGAYCERNQIFEDGMHFCTETMAARIGAGIACLLGCVYNRNGPETEPHQEASKTQSPLELRISKIRDCERKCNEQFLSVMPIKESWVVDSSSTLASFSGI